MKKIEASDTAAPRTMSVLGFVDFFARQHRTMPNRPFCFLLGAGASRSSGIPTGGELVNQWLATLHREDPEHGGMEFEAWVKAGRHCVELFDPEDWAAAYPHVYARLFGDDPDAGYAFLEDAMQGARPSYGYTVLAQIVAETQHKVVITTNFDNLVADSVALCSRTFPLVCGHDSLAGFARPLPRRPLVLKVHHDLLLGPKSDPASVSKLGEGYARALEKLLEHYTPVVVGYGGNDGSLMGALQTISESGRPIPGGVYWCYRAKDGLPRPAIREFVARQKGRLVAIDDFDLLMALLAQKLEIGLADEIILRRATEHAKALVEKYQELKAELEKPAKATKTAASEGEKAALEALRDLASEPAKTRRWWQWDTLAKAEPDPAKRQEIYEEAIRALPNEAALLGNYALFLETIRQDHDRAQLLYEQALEADPKHASILGNYALFLETIRQDHNRAQQLYERALEADPKHANHLGNYAGFLLSRGQHEKGLAMLERAMAALGSTAPRALHTELWFYAFAHGPQARRAEALRHLYRLLVDQGIRSPGWDFSANIARAIADGHPEAAWLPKLAEVINGKAEPSILDDWPAWQEAGQQLSAERSSS